MSPSCLCQRQGSHPNKKITAEFQIYLQVSRRTTKTNPLRRWAACCCIQTNSHNKNPPLLSIMCDFSQQLLAFSQEQHLLSKACSQTKSVLFFYQNGKSYERTHTCSSFPRLLQDVLIFPTFSQAATATHLSGCLERKTSVLYPNLHGACVCLCECVYMWVCVCTCVTACSSDWT